MPAPPNPSPQLAGLNAASSVEVRPAPLATPARGCVRASRFPQICSLVLVVEVSPQHPSVRRSEAPAHPRGHTRVFVVAVPHHCLKFMCKTYVQALVLSCAFCRRVSALRPKRLSDCSLPRLTFESSARAWAAVHPLRVSCQLILHSPLRSRLLLAHFVDGGQLRH